MITKIIGDKEYRLTIKQDDGFNPREDSNLGKIIYSHRRHTLGDEELTYYGYSLYQDFLIHINKEYDIIEIEYLYSLSEKEIESIEKFIYDNIVYLPVYCYDHGLVTINTTGFSCGWDSGQVGYIYSHKDNIKELILKEGEDGETKLKEILNSEINYFDKYIRGDFYYCRLDSRDIKTIDGKIYYNEWEYEESYSSLYEPIDILDYISIFTKEEIEYCEITY